LVRVAIATNLTMTFLDRLVAVTSSAAARTITSRPSTSVPVGDINTVVDESGTARTNIITVAARADDVPRRHWSARTRLPGSTPRPFARRSDGRDRCRYRGFDPTRSSVAPSPVAPSQ
jgi:hypothetical protein